MVTSPSEVANLLASSFTSVSSTTRFSPKFRALKEVHEKIQQAACTIPDDQLNISLSPAEFPSALTSARDSYPGPDNIHYRMSGNFSDNRKSGFNYLFNK